MQVLLDSHIVYWAIIEPQKLGQRIVEILRDPVTYTAWVSSISFAEFRIKESVGKLNLPESFNAEVVALGYNLLPFTFEHAARLESLPLIHRDPFDRMLIAQALTERLTILTADRVFEDYPAKLVLN